MIAGLKPYPAVKDSGVPWLAAVPTHWARRRVKSLLRAVDRRSLTGRETLLSLRRDHGIVVYSEHFSRPAQGATTVGYKIVNRGQLVVNRLQANNGLIFDSSLDGLVSPDYSVFEPREEIVLRYLSQLFRTATYRDHFRRESTGLGTGSAGFLRLYDDRFLETPVVLPPVPEQAAIVRFVDHADRRVRRYIRAKQKLITLLEEHRQGIIHRAVTRGIDPDVPLRPSGLEWLGEVPKHWQVSRVKAEFTCLNSRRIPLSGTQRGAMTARRYDYYGASGVIDKVDDYLFDDELLLIAEDGANLVLRHLPLAIIARGKFWVNNHAHILKPKRGNLHYLAAVMEGIDYLPWISGAAQPKLTQDRLMGIAIAVPPRHVQDRIVASISSETASLRATIERARRELDLLRDYRARLIADVVIGKLDVREAAARLPDEVDESDERDEVDTEAEVDESDEADAVVAGPDE